LLAMLCSLWLIGDHCVILVYGYHCYGIRIQFERRAMTKINRREFVEKAAVVAGAISLGVSAEAGTYRGLRTATDRVKLGKTGIKSSLVGIGTGSIGWNHASNQTRLGQAKFTELIRHAFDSGITFFDVADQYGSHPFLKEAIKGLPRDKFVIQSKSNSRTPE